MGKVYPNEASFYLFLRPIPAEGNPQGPMEMLGTWSYRDIVVKVGAESQQKCPFDQVGWKMGTSEDSPPKL